MIKNIFLTGEKGLGKSTLLNKVLKEFSFELGGYFTTREFLDGGVKFYMNDFITNKSQLFADFTQTKDIKKETFEVFGAGLLKSALQTKDVIILDELGTMEENFPLFKKSVYDVLNSDKLALGVLKKCDCSFIDSIKYRDDIKVFEVTKENRDQLFIPLCRAIKSSLNH